MSCSALLFELAQSVSDVNDLFIDNYTDKSMEYMLSCVKTNVTFDRYYEIMRNNWEKRINDFLF